jgi:hypothetical protein
MKVVTGWGASLSIWQQDGGFQVQSNDTGGYAITDEATQRAEITVAFVAAPVGTAAQHKSFRTGTHEVPRFLLLLR